MKASVQDQSKGAAMRGSDLNPSVKRKVDQQSNQNPASTSGVSLFDRIVKLGPAKKEAPAEKKSEARLEKLQRRTRAEDEVKHALKPFYSKRDITKDEYKAIMRKAVPKVSTSQ